MAGGDDGTLRRTTGSSTTGSARGAAERTALGDFLRAAREVHRDREDVAAEAVGALRLDAGRHPDDALLNELVGELTIESGRFSTWWNAHRVHERTHGTKRLQHPAIGAITIRFQALTLPGEPDQTLFLYTTDPGSSSSDDLRLLASWATRRTGTGDRPGNGR